MRSCLAWLPLKSNTLPGAHVVEQSLAYPDCRRTAFTAYENRAAVQSAQLLPRCSGAKSSELLNLVEYGCEPFDLVVINASLANGTLDLLDFFRDNPQVRHAFIYDGQQEKAPSIPTGEQQKVRVTHALMPDLSAIQHLMAIVDRHVPFVPISCLEDRVGEFVIKKAGQQKIPRGGYRG